LIFGVFALVNFKKPEIRYQNSSLFYYRRKRFTENHSGGFLLPKLNLSGFVAVFISKI